ncbi:MAG: alpha/beta hydrolase [Agarilytica sp.]
MTGFGKQLITLSSILALSCIFSFSASASSFGPLAPGGVVEDEGFVTLSTGPTVHYLSKGEQGSKPLMLFIHGAPERAEVWEDYMRFFSHDYFTVAYTTRGYHPSSIPENVSDYTVTNLAADALAVAQSFGYDSFTVVGHDWGAATAWRTAINYPDAVERLVVFSNPHPLMYARAYHESPEHKALIDAYIPLARDSVSPWTREGTLANDLDHFKNYVYPNETKKKLSWAMADMFEETWSFENGASIDAIYNHYKALDWPLTTLNTCNPAPWISLTVDQPVMLLYGEKDRFVAPEAYGLENNDCNTNTIYVPFADGNHFIHHEYKEEILWKMWYFLNQEI